MFWPFGCWCWSVLASWVRYLPPTCRAQKFRKHCPTCAPLSSRIKKNGLFCFAVPFGAPNAFGFKFCDIVVTESAPTWLKFLEPE